MKVLFGLGNPGKEYSGTRHNLGFNVIDWLALHFSVDVRKKFAGALTAEVNDASAGKFILAKPQTYVNKSGGSAAEIIRWHKVSICDLLVVCDDINLPVGKIRFRAAGSAGGHNGLKSIIEHIQTDEFNRLRVGVGKPDDDKNSDLAEYVLDTFSPQEMPHVKKSVEKAGEVCLDWLSGRVNPPATFDVADKDV